MVVIKEQRSEVQPKGCIIDKSLGKLMKGLSGNDDGMAIKVGQSEFLFNYLAMRHGKLH
jgi:hypothetical protein